MRYKEYNTNKVLEKCIRLFWAKGFKGCSINEIVEETGVNRFSLYHEFQDKNGLLYASLKLYKERYSDPNTLLLKEDGSTSQILTNFLLSFLNDKDEFQGCYLIHIGTELADEIPQINKLVKTYLHDIETELIRVLKQDLNTKSHAHIYARQLVGLFCTTMSFCLILNDEEKANHIEKSINVILSKKFSHATSS